MDPIVLVLFVQFVVPEDVGVSHSLFHRIRWVGYCTHLLGCTQGMSAQLYNMNLAEIWKHNQQKHWHPQGYLH